MQAQFDDTLDHHGAFDAYAQMPPAPNKPRRGIWENGIQFGRFCAFPRSRQLLLDGRPQEIGGRAFDLLMVLLRSNGGIVSKNEILNEVWPSMVVEECNLRFQIGSLRKALGDQGNLIKTIVRRGYMLVREDTWSSEGAEQIDPELAASSPGPVESPNDAVTAPYIALIEDDEGVRLSISSLLRSVGFRVGAFDTVKNYQANCSELPDCLILDVCLPGRSGLDFQADLSKADVRFPIIFISGQADIQMSVRAMKAGAAEFLTKPVRHQDLLTAVESAMAEPSH